MINFDVLLRKADKGQISEAEISSVVTFLQAHVQPDESPNAWSEIYSALSIIEVVADEKYRPVVNKFLFWPTFPMISSLALRILCTSWEPCNDCRKIIVTFLTGVEWDEEGDLIFSAIQAGTKFYIRNSDREILRLIYNISQDESPEKIEERAAAYQGLAEILGYNVGDFIKFDLEKRTSVTVEITHKIAKRLAQGD